MTEESECKPETLVLMHKSRFQFSPLLTPLTLHSFQLICLFSQIENEKSYRSKHTMLIMKNLAEREEMEGKKREKKRVKQED
jgi:hypothetical protein